MFFFALKGSSGHVECNFDNPGENYIQVYFFGKSPRFSPDTQKSLLTTLPNNFCSMSENRQFMKFSLEVLSKSFVWTRVIVFDNPVENFLKSVKAYNLFQKKFSPTCSGKKNYIMLQPSNDVPFYF